MEILTAFRPDQIPPGNTPRLDANDAPIPSENFNSRTASNKPPIVCNPERYLRCSLPVPKRNNATIGAPIGIAGRAPYAATTYRPLLMQDQ